MYTSLFDLAVQVGVSTHTIRYHEGQGRIPAALVIAGRRVYTAELAEAVKSYFAGRQRYERQAEATPGNHAN